MKRTPEQREYHAEKERGYRAQRKRDREAAIARFAESAATLRRSGYSVGQLVDLILSVEDAR